MYFAFICCTYTTDNPWAVHRLWDMRTTSSPSEQDEITKQLYTITSNTNKAIKFTLVYNMNMGSTFICPLPSSFSSWVAISSSISFVLQCLRFIGRSWGWRTFCQHEDICMSRNYKYGASIKHTVFILCSHVTTMDAWPATNGYFQCRVL